jgi:hypothetical protein
MKQLEANNLKQQDNDQTKEATNKDDQVKRCSYTNDIKQREN